VLGNDPSGGKRAIRQAVSSTALRGASRAIASAGGVGIVAGALAALAVVSSVRLLRRLSSSESPRVAATAARLRGDRVGTLIESNRAAERSDVPRDDIFADFRE